MENNNSIQIGQIEQSFDIRHTAFCNGCCAELSHYDNDPKRFAQTVYEKGWRCNSNADLVCPSCLIKYP